MQYLGARFFSNISSYIFSSTGVTPGCRRGGIRPRRTRCDREGGVRAFASVLEKGSTGKSNREAGIEPSRGKSGKCPPRMIPRGKDERRRWIRRSRCTKAIGMRSRQRHRGCRCCRRRRHRTTGPTDAIADGRGGGDESGGPSPRGGRGERSPRSLGKTSPRRRRKQSFRSCLKQESRTTSTSSESNGGKPSFDCISAAPSDDCSGGVPSFSPDDNRLDPRALLEVDVPRLFSYN